MKISNILSDRNFNPKLKTQLIASFIIMNIIIISIISILVYKGILGILKQQSDDMLTEQSRQSEYNILSYRDQIEHVADLLAINKSLQDFINLDENNDQSMRISFATEIIKQFDGVMSNYNLIDSIYLFCPNGEAVSVSTKGSWYRQNALIKCAFYKANLYREIQDLGFGFIWGGTNSTSDFELNDYSTLSPETNYITMARNVSVLTQSNQKAVIVINIKQNSLLSIYNGITGDKRNNKYLINADGTIISDIDSNLIGKRVELANKIDVAKKNGSFRIIDNAVPKQITYYKLGETGWVLVNEIAESDFIQNILSLKKIVVFMFVISVLLALLLSMYWIYRITRPFNHLTDAMQKMGDGNLGILLDETPKTELGLIGRKFNKMSKNIEELIEKNKLIEEDKRHLEMEALQTQINPHFLYNALNTLKWIAVVKNETSIADGMTALGNMLRPIFKDRSLMVPIKDEIEYIENYLKIMNARYGEGIKVIFDIPEDVKHFMIIRFILQPVVENSFMHGMISKNYIGVIKITAKKEENAISITIEDNGVGIKEERLKEIEVYLNNNNNNNNNNTINGSIGLLNVNRRLILQYGISHKLLIENIENGTKVTVKIPVVNKS